MGELASASVDECLVKLRLGAVAQCLDAIFSAASRTEYTYLDFLDQLLAEDTETKQRKRVAMDNPDRSLPPPSHLDDFDFKFQLSLNAKLVR